MRKKTAVVLMVTLFFILWGPAYAYAPGSEVFLQSFAEADEVQDAVLIIDGESIDLTKLLNAEIQLFNGQALGILTGSNTQVIQPEKRVQITLNNAIIGMQFLNANVAKTNTSFALRYSDKAQAALVITAPQVKMNNNSLEVITSGSGKHRICCLLDLEKRDTATAIRNMRPVLFPNKAASYLFLVNSSNPLNKNFVPSNLEIIPTAVRAYQSKKEMRMVSAAVSDLGKMLEQAGKEGVKSFCLTSTYRTFSYQSILFKNKVKQLKSEEKAAQVVALPGTSEHQSGLAMDICRYGAGLTEDFAWTSQGKWLAKNGWKYGFILRYPADKTAVTKIIYEPWHYRYVGYPYSKIMFDRKLCLEEFLDNIKQYGYYAVTDQNYTYLTGFDPGENKIYLSEAVPKVPAL